MTIQLSEENEQDLILDSALAELPMVELPASFVTNTMAQIVPQPTFKFSVTDVALPIIGSLLLAVLLWVWRAYSPEIVAQMPAFSFSSGNDFPAPTILYILTACVVGYIATMWGGISLWLDWETEP